MSGLHRHLLSRKKQVGTHDLDSRLKNMALTIMAPSGFCTSLVISGSLPSVDLAAHSLMELTALLLSLKFIFEWS